MQSSISGRRKRCQTRADAARSKIGRGPPLGFSSSGSSIHSNCMGNISSLSTASNKIAITRKPSSLRRLKWRTWWPSSDWAVCALKDPDASRI
eukprot:5147572-Pyramimonas_sp.AAC.1